jgi:hypothetical protein
MPDRIYIELINYPMLFKLKASAAEYKAGLDLAIERGWLEDARVRHLCPALEGGGRQLRRPSEPR